MIYLLNDQNYNQQYDYLLKTLSNEEILFKAKLNKILKTDYELNVFNQLQLSNLEQSEKDDLLLFLSSEKDMHPDDKVKFKEDVKKVFAIIVNYYDGDLKHLNFELLSKVIRMDVDKIKRFSNTRAYQLVIKSKYDIKYDIDLAISDILKTNFGLPDYLSQMIKESPYNHRVKEVLLKFLLKLNEVNINENIFIVVKLHNMLKELIGYKQIPEDRIARILNKMIAFTNSENPIDTLLTPISVNDAKNSIIDELQKLRLINSRVISIDNIQEDKLKLMAKFLDLANLSHDPLTKKLIQSALFDLQNKPEILAEFISTTFNNISDIKSIDELKPILANHETQFCTNLLGLSNDQTNFIINHPNKDEILNFFADEKHFPVINHFNKSDIHYVVQMLYKFLSNPDREVTTLLKDLSGKKISSYLDAFKTNIRDNFIDKFGYTSDELNDIGIGVDEQSITQLARGNEVITIFSKSIKSNIQSEADKTLKLKQLVYFSDKFKKFYTSTILDSLNQEEYNKIITGDYEHINQEVTKYLIQDKIKNSNNGTLDLSGLSLTDDEFEFLVLPILRDNTESFTAIDLGNNSLINFPDLTSLPYFHNIESLNFKNNKISQFPEANKMPTGIRELNFEYNTISDFPPYLNNLTNLSYLNMERNTLSYDANDIMFYKPESLQNIEFGFEQRLKDNMLEDLHENLRFLFDVKNENGTINNKETLEMSEFIKNFSKTYDVDSERLGIRMNRTGRAVLTELLCTVKLDPEDPLSKVYKEALVRELNELKNGSSEQQDFKLLTLQPLTGNCQTPINEALIDSEIECWENGKSNIPDKDMKVLLQYKALKDHIETDPIIRGLLPKTNGEKIEIVAALLNAVLYKGADQHPDNRLRIIGNDNQLEGHASNLEFGFKQLHKKEYDDLLHEVAKLVSDGNGVPQNDNIQSFKYKFDAAKLEDITKKYQIKKQLAGFRQKVNEIHQKIETLDYYDESSMKKYYDYNQLENELISRLKSVAPENYKLETDKYLADLEKLIEEATKQIIAKEANKEIIHEEAISGTNTELSASQLTRFGESQATRIQPNRSNQALTNTAQTMATVQRTTSPRSRSTSPIRR